MTTETVDHRICAADRTLSLWAVPTCLTGDDGIPLLLLHGSAYSALSVFHFPARKNSQDDYSLLRALADRGLDSYALDFTGYGGSRQGEQVPEGLAWFLEDARAAATFIRERTGRNPVVLGWSWGAQVAAGLSESADVAGLIFWGGVWGGHAEHVPLPLQGLARPDTPWRTNSYEHAVSDFLTPGTYDPQVRDEFGTRALEIDPRSPWAARAALVTGLPLFDPRNIHHPVLIVHGDRDPFVDEQDLKSLAALRTRSRTDHVVVRGADHNVQFSRARARFADVIAEFCGSIRPKQLGTSRES